MVLLQKLNPKWRFVLTNISAPQFYVFLNTKRFVKRDLLLCLNLINNFFLWVFHKIPYMQYGNQVPIFLWFLYNSLD